MPLPALAPLFARCARLRLSRGFASPRLCLAPAVAPALCPSLVPPSLAAAGRSALRGVLACPPWARLARAGGAGFPLPPRFVALLLAAAAACAALPSFLPARALVARPPPRFFSGAVRAPCCGAPRPRGFCWGGRLRSCAFGVFWASPLAPVGVLLRLSPSAASSAAKGAPAPCHQRKKIMLPIPQKLNKTASLFCSIYP